MNIPTFRDTLDKAFSEPSICLISMGSNIPVSLLIADIFFGLSRRYVPH